MSFMILVGASGVGYERRDVSAIASLMSLKAFEVLSSQASGCLVLAVASKVSSYLMMSAQCGIKW